MNPLLRFIPDEAACLRDLAKMVGVVVIVDPFRLYASHLSEVQTKDCLDRTVPLLGGKTSRSADGMYQVAVGDSVVALDWSDGIMTAAPVNSPRSAGPADQQLVDLAATIPPRVFGFMLMKASADKRVKNIVITVGLDHASFDVIARGEGVTAADAKNFFDELLRGFKDAAPLQNIALDDSWITQRLEGSVAILEAKIPVAVFMTRKPVASAKERVEAISLASGDGAAAAATALRYVHAVAAQDFKSMCSARAKNEQADLARMAGSCEEAFRAIMKDKPVTVFSTLQAKQARRRATMIAVDLVQPGQTEPATTLIATQEAGQWVLIDVADADVF